MIQYGRQKISSTDIESVVDVLRSDWLTQGPMVPRFEKAVADYVKVKFGLATNSATSALHIACLALEVGPGDKVWTSPNTFVASANCAIYCGAEVDFIDIDRLTNNISVDFLQKKLIEAKKLNALPKVVIPVHFSGQPCDMISIKKLSDEYGFKIIEDASHAIGSSYGSNKIGNCEYSDITVFSFHPVKIITTGEGGMAMTNETNLSVRMIRHRSHGITCHYQHMQPRPEGEIWNYQQIDIGHNYRMTEIQAALGLSQLKSLDQFIERRHAIARRYDEAISDLPLILPHQSFDRYSSYHIYIVRIREVLCRKTQRQVYDALLNAGIGINLHYIPVYRHPFYEKKGFKKGYCPEAELYFKETITLPIHPSLNNKEQDYIIHNIRQIIKSN
jgi:UDP-4-amino-4,6-dideoxy-N-acetyl-beta-L-altrosamine transaminase|tara:strand:+ start:975 stop:2141 length:1167 start_codon:yes stop_codon:yes gene_type:complete